MKHPTSSLLDAGAIALSTLCLLHCLALPLLAAALPLLGVWAEAEWVHVLFVAIAAPTTAFALWRAHLHAPLPWMAGVVAVVGLLFLLAGAAEFPNHESETVMTVAGSLMLAGVHVWNARRRHRHA